MVLTVFYYRTGYADAAPGKAVEIVTVGILIGTLTMELGGIVTIKCEKTGYWAELEFKLKVCTI